MKANSAAFPADPQQALSDSSPGEVQLAALDQQHEFKDTPTAVRTARGARESRSRHFRRNGCAPPER